MCRLRKISANSYKASNSLVHFLRRKRKKVACLEQKYVELEQYHNTNPIGKKNQCQNVLEIFKNYKTLFSRSKFVAI